MQQIPKDLVLAAVVRTFFKYFTAGVLETQSGGNTLDRYEPRNVKQTMLSHYEKIATVFNEEAFYAIFRMNYEEAEMESVLRNFVTKTTRQIDLVRLACRTNELYSAMIAEYKRNFELLLCGRIATAEEPRQAFTHCPGAGNISREKAESIITALANNAYSRGRDLSCGAKPQTKA